MQDRSSILPLLTGSRSRFPGIGASIDMSWFSNMATATTIALLAWAAAADIAARIIPDSCAIALALLGLASRAVHGLPEMAITIALALTLFVLLVVLHARGMLGGGDVKLASAAALGLSPDSLYRFVVVTTLAGGVLALLYLVLRPMFRGVRTTPPARGTSFLHRVASAERWRIARRGSLPYGVAIACGGIWAVLASPGG